MSNRITDCRIRPVMAPLEMPHKTASGTLEAAPLVLIDVIADDGIVGSTYIFAYTPAALEPLAALSKNIASSLVGETAEPGAVSALLDARFRLLGNQGLVAMAISGIDMALWDAAAKRKEKPLYELLGGKSDPVRVYDSLGQMGPDETARVVEASLERGFRAFKIKAGHPDPKTDVAVVRSIRDVAGKDVWVAADFNQAFGVDEAVRRMSMLDEEGLAWIEEPVQASDYQGHATVRSAIRTPVQTGENWWGMPDMRNAVAAKASDLAMPDVMKIGGVSGWREAASLANEVSLPVASHLFVEISAHLLNATPTAMILEWFDIAGTIITCTPEIADGFAIPSQTPGAGILWDESAIEKIIA
ncbi:enolase C-terminal domain-like protein [uncultured Roseibium sp.]|uniref:enolase C-terminal domain-like protein n=1 Tax=uncultured Roseibium sp. TaxID=1936171 RepID=UPI0026125336|nr:enolase C-terminal domain-like protein [uncultured Roseibium sp.]